jgi:predicted KAP-like P-loop ATPase
VQQAFKHALVVLKLNDKVSTKLGDKVNEHLQEFFMKIGGGVNESGQQTRGDFLEKISGYCVVYPPLAVAFIETEDEEFLEEIFTSINDMVTSATPAPAGG